MIDLNPQHLATVERILAEHVPQCEVRAFGSRVRWTAKDYSDLDLAVVCAGALDRRLLERLEEAFEESDLPMRADVLDWWRIEESFREVIAKRYEVLGAGLLKTTFARLIADDALEIGDGYRAKNVELGGDGPIFLRGAYVRDSGFQLGSPDRIRTDVIPKLKGKWGRAGDVVVTTKGNSTGRVAFIPNDMPEFVYSPHLSYWRSLDLARLDQGFLRYWSRCREFQMQLEAMKGSTDMAPYLSLRDQKRLVITVLPIDQQRRIATILGALDDKIELNRKMNRTLEAMAQAIFKSWFIDFDGHTDLVDSELGPVPKRWKVVRVGELLELAYGKALPARSRVPGDVPVIGSGGVAGSHSTSLVRGPGIVVGRKGTIGTVYWVDDDFFPIDTTFYVRTKKAETDLPWLYRCLKEMAIEQLGTHSAVPGVSRNSIYARNVVAPPNDLMSKFGCVTSSLTERTRLNEAESRTLAALRDTLLPKLISGEIRVPEAERAVEQVVA